MTKEYLEAVEAEKTALHDWLEKAASARHCADNTKENPAPLAEAAWQAKKEWETKHAAVLAMKSC